MFDDAKKELKRLEEELLSEPEQEEQPEAFPEDDTLVEEPTEPVVYSNYANHYGRDLRNYASGYRAYNADHTDEDVEVLSEELQNEKESRGNRVLIVTALVLLVTIALVLGWILWRIGGAA